ncbi:MAG: NYN domain-containing protein [Cyanobacteria bacterium CRU_2_1]|nr:NYN domain-containing protein [Cyanobacteria bacterium RU_5_0]NJR63037.1 NYN domain-containing protein [Cyanobacteria bacterium CRU_2_1]
MFPKVSVAIYLDWQNVRLNQNQANKLFNLASREGILGIKKAYAYWRKEDLSRQGCLYKNGFDCLDIPLLEKNSADHKLMADIRWQIVNDPSLKTVILVSGDGDFVQLVSEMKLRGIKVIVVAQSNVSQKLRKLADEFYPVHDLCKQVT